MATVPTQNPLFVRCFKNNLHDVFIRGYAFSAPAKSGVGIGVPVKLQATNDAPASFLLSALAHIQIMAGRMGESKDSPVSCNAGYANPVRSATHEIGVSGGGIRYPLQEAAVMATTPTQSHPVSARHNHVNKPFFVFRFWSPHLLMRDTIATSEKQARSRLRRPSWTLDKRYPIPVTDAVYQVVSLMRYTDGRRRTCQHREIWTSREQAEEHAARVAFMTDYVTVTADVVEVFHV
ncbi:ash family protein [Salmonella enterica]|nr:ash family protein [Salmonella enterica]ELQ3564948.1 ash family protein [Salmonella enterica]